VNQRIFATVDDNFTFGTYTYFITLNGMLWKRRHGYADASFLSHLDNPVLLSKLAEVIKKDQPEFDVDFRWRGAD
jgi:hypothetical protein